MKNWKWLRAIFTLLFALVGLGVSGKAPTKVEKTEVVQTHHFYYAVDVKTSEISAEILTYAYRYDGPPIVGILPSTIFIEKQSRPVASYLYPVTRPGKYRYLDGVDYALPFVNRT